MNSPARPNPALVEQRQLLAPFYAAVDGVLIGQRSLVDRLLIGLLSDGHVLLEGVPGLAKTLAVRTVAAALDLRFSRIQFTPDLLPADVVGTQIYNPASGTFSVRPGPIVTNVLLADEINRAPAKVQSALLEAMQERQFTLGEVSHALPSPFFVIATQNPLEQEGTYPLPEAQVDRFLLKTLIDYPSKENELAILDRVGSVDADVHVQPMLSRELVMTLRAAIDAIYLDERVKVYLVDVVRSTRKPSDYGLTDLNPLIEVGASPRASLALLRATKAHAFLAGRHYVSPEDVKAMAPDVLRHRVRPSFEAEAENVSSDSIIARILSQLPVP